MAPLASRLAPPQHPLLDHLVFETTYSRRHQSKAKSKIRVPVAPRKGYLSFNFFLNSYYISHNDDFVFLFLCICEGHKKSNEGRQLTLTLILVCVAFLLLASPLFTLIVVFTFVDPLASARRFANFTLMKNIFEQVCLCYSEAY